MSLSAVRLKRTYPTPMKNSASRTQAASLSRGLLHAQESLSSLVASGLSLLAKEHIGKDVGSVTASERWWTALPWCSAWASLAADGGRNIQRGVVFLWPRQHFRACTALGPEGAGFGGWGLAVQRANVGSTFLVCAGAFEAPRLVSL